MMALKTRQEMATLAQLIPQEKGYFYKNITVYIYMQYAEKFTIKIFIRHCSYIFLHVNKQRQLMIIETLSIAISLQFFNNIRSYQLSVNFAHELFGLFS